MQISRFKLLLPYLATILFVAVLGQAVAQHAEVVLRVCASEHQEGGQDDESHCPCVCHHLQTAVAGWNVAAPSPLSIVADVVERPQTVAEAPTASIEYPPQLA